MVIVLAFAMIAVALQATCIGLRHCKTLIQGATIRSAIEVTPKSRIDAGNGDEGAQAVDVEVGQGQRVGSGSAQDGPECLVVKERDRETEIVRGASSMEGLKYYPRRSVKGSPEKGQGFSSRSGTVGAASRGLQPW